MEVEWIDAQRVAENAASVLGTAGPSLGLMSPEGLAASLRRAASFSCPTTATALVGSVAEVLSGLPGFTEETRTELEKVVDMLISYGDLLELPSDEAGRNRRLIFLGPPSWVQLAVDRALLIGVRPEGAPLLTDELMDSVEHRSYASFIKSRDGAPIQNVLAPEGLIELKSNQWLKAPRQCSPDLLRNFYADRLKTAGPPGDIDGLTLIDPEKSVTYYRGRWRGAKSRDSGYFVARRPQAFGANLWCFTKLDGGKVVTIIDLPIESALALGADEAWRLQAALDSIAGHPQLVGVRKEDANATIDFFSPMPSWIQRRMDVVGARVRSSPGALFSYVVPFSAVKPELNYLAEMMWLGVRSNGSEAA